MSDGILQARSLLFVPGDRPDRFDKATATQADLVVCDLEDAVAPAHKVQARGDVAWWLAAGGLAAVRVNSCTTDEGEGDCAVLAGSPGLLAVMVPKAEDPAALRRVVDTLGGRVPVIALLETATGVAHAREIAGTEGVARLAFGSLDLAADLDCDPYDELALLPARAELVFASRLAGLAAPVDGVTTTLDDVTITTADANRSRSLGFGGKLCIHPRQVLPVNTAFTSSRDEVAWANRVLTAAGGHGAVRVDGQLVDPPVVNRAQRILRRADPHTAASRYEQQEPT